MRAIKARTSPKRLIVGGAEILPIKVINQATAKLGQTKRTPLEMAILRVPENLYRAPAIANIAQEEAPCAAIITTPAAMAGSERANKHAIQSLMCPTEEYAIRTFVSVCVRQRALATSPPAKEKP